MLQFLGNINTITLKGTFLAFLPVRDALWPVQISCPAVSPHFHKCFLKSGEIIHVVNILHGKVKRKQW